MLKLIGDGAHAGVIRALTSKVEWPADCWFVAVGDNAARKKESLACPGPFVVINYGLCLETSPPQIGDGTVIMPGAVIMNNVRIGKHCIINTGATINHDCVIGDFAHIAPGANLCGGVHVGEGSLVGVGVSIEPNVQIPAWHIVKRAPYVIEPVSGN